MILPSVIMPNTGVMADELNNQAVIDDSAGTANSTEDSSNIMDYLNGLFSSTGENILQSMEFNSAEAEKNRSWLERMSSSAYQRAVADMKKAGLNPLLAYGVGAQAATPTSTAASINTVAGDTFGSLLSVAASLLSSIADFLPSVSHITSKVTSNNTSHGVSHIYHHK